MTQSTRTVPGICAKASALLAFTLLLLPAAHVAAENRAGAFTFEPFAGGQGFPFGGETHFDADFDWGFHAGYNFTEHLGAELVFGLNKTVHDPEAQYCNIYQYGADVLYFFRPEKRLVPFVAAGFGVFDVHFDDTSEGEHPNDDETNPYFNIGVGLEYALTSWLGARADFREAIMLNNGDQAMQGVVGFRFQF